MKKLTVLLAILFILTSCSNVKTSEKVNTNESPSKQTAEDVIDNPDEKIIASKIDRNIQNDAVEKSEIDDKEVNEDSNKETQLEQNSIDNDTNNSSETISEKEEDINESDKKVEDKKEPTSKAKDKNKTDQEEKLPVEQNKPIDNKPIDEKKPAKNIVPVETQDPKEKEEPKPAEDPEKPKEPVEELPEEPEVSIEEPKEPEVEKLLPLHLYHNGNKVKFLDIGIDNYNIERTQKYIDDGNIISTVTKFDPNDNEVTYFSGHTYNFNGVAELDMGSILTITDSKGIGYKYKIVDFKKYPAGVVETEAPFIGGYHLIDLAGEGIGKESIVVQYCDPNDIPIIFFGLPVK